MRHSFMEAVAQGLAHRAIATLRYNFPYMERGSKRPDAPALAHATVRAAVAEAQRRLPGLPLVAGGKSFGGRMTSQAQSATPLPGGATHPTVQQAARARSGDPLGAGHRHGRGRPGMARGFVGGCAAQAGAPFSPLHSFSPRGVRDFLVGCGAPRV